MVDSEAQPADPPPDSDELFKIGETRRDNGNYAGAGDAQERALEALSDDGRRGNVGATAALRAAEDYWQAFILDGDLAHLRAGIRVLERWLELAGPQSDASLLPDVERNLSEIRTVVGPLEDFGVALGAGEFEPATEYYNLAMGALSSQERPWSVGARITLMIARAHVHAYEQSDIEAADIEVNRSKLDMAKKLLEQSLGLRQPNDEDNKSEGVAKIEELLADVEGRLEEADRRLAAVAEEARALDERREKERREELATRERAEQFKREAQQAAKARRWSIALLGLGVVGIAGGATVVGDGVAFSVRAQQIVRIQEAEAEQLEQTPEVRFDRQVFDVSVQQYEQQVRARTLAELIGGSVALAGGVATSVVGILRLVRGRERRDAGSGTHERLVPSIIVLVAGVTGTGVGAGLLGDGIVVNGETQQDVRAQQAEAQQLVQVHGDGFDQDSFEASAREYEDRGRTRTTTEVVSGSVLITGGIAASIVGLVGVVRSRKHGSRARGARLVPSVSRSQLGLSLVTRF